MTLTAIHSGYMMSGIAKELFDSHRSKLIGLAYRMTGSRCDAEDIVNDAFLKWLDSDHAEIQSPQAWLTKVTTRLSLDFLKSARVQRENYIGPWLPEPYIEDHETPDHQHELDQSISLALMVLFETLSPAERASFILHDLFNFSFEEVGGILDKSAPTCRKLASRARNKVQQAIPTKPCEENEMVEMGIAFFNAIRNGKMNDLLVLLKDKVVFHTDSDGKAAAALKVLQGNHVVAEFLMRVLHPVVSNVDNLVEIKHTWFNGSPGVIIWDNNQPVSAFSFVIEENRISRVFVHRNPEKLKAFF